MSVLGFPEELNFQSLKSMYPSRKQKYRKAPMNSQTFTAAGQDIQLVFICAAANGFESGFPGLTITSLDAREDYY